MLMSSGLDQATSAKLYAYITSTLDLPWIAGSLLPAPAYPQAIDELKGRVDSTYQQILAQISASEAAVQREILLAQERCAQLTREHENRMQEIKASLALDTDLARKRVEELKLEVGNKEQEIRVFEEQELGRVRQLIDAMEVLVPWKRPPPFGAWIRSLFNNKRAI